MWLTDLADAARKSGLKVDGVPGWRTRGTGPMRAVKTITCHHTATTAAAKGDIPTLHMLANGHSNLTGPLCNIGLSRTGVVWIVAAGAANHAGVSHRTEYTNQYAIGIEAEHPGGKTLWPAKQYDAYVRLCRALADHYKLPISAVMGHKETAAPAGRKVDPSFDMAQFRKDITNLAKPKKDVLDMDEKKVRAIVADEVKKALRNYDTTAIIGKETTGVATTKGLTQLATRILDGDGAPGRDQGVIALMDQLSDVKAALCRIETEVTR